jgi:hypothetical protein
MVRVFVDSQIYGDTLSDIYGGPGTLDAVSQQGNTEMLLLLMGVVRSTDASPLARK